MAKAGVGGLIVLIFITMLAATALESVFENILALSPLVLLGIALLLAVVYARFKGAVTNVPTSTIIVIAVVVVVLGFMGWGSGASAETITFTEV